MTVADPYRPADADETLEKLERRVAGREGAEDTAVTAFLLLLPLIIVGTVLATLVATSQALAPAWVTLGVGGFLALLAAAFTVGSVVRQGVTDDRYLKLVKEWKELPTARRATPALRRLSTALRELPQEQRNECRPLWEAALKANALLLEDPSHPGALERIEERARAAERLREQHRRFAALQERASREDRVRALESAYFPLDDSDLESVNIYTEALQAGIKRYEELLP